VKLSDLTKVQPKKENTQAETVQEIITPFTQEQLQKAWNEFAEKRKPYPAEYQMLTQTIELRDQYQVILHIHNPVQESMLVNVKSELAGYLRDKLKNTALNVIGELKEVDERKKIYSQREKFDYLVAKNPILKELKDRLGLDTDF
jgi:DNA polymerase-3 subunit gamma/tau